MSAARGHVPQGAPKAGSIGRVDRARRRYIIMAPLAAVWACSMPALRTISTLEPGRGQFKMTDVGGSQSREIPVWYAVPENLTSRSPVLFVLPGTYRNADVYRDVWAPHAERGNALLLVPQFPKRAFPGAAGYNLGNMVDKDGSWNDRSEWAFSVIERLFDEARGLTGITRRGYQIYGHSAGAQFVQRFVLFMPKARVAGAVAANAGWYTLPSFEQEFPYGLAGSPLSAADLKTALGRKLTVLVGEKDNDANHPRLRATKMANFQGDTRLDRGHFLLESAKHTAGSMNVDLRWRLFVVPGVGHSNRQMAPAAARYLLA